MAMIKDKKLWLRVTSTDKQQIKQIARENGLNVTEYVLLRCKEKIVINKMDFNAFKASIHQAAQEINAIGNNINQVTHAIHLCNRQGFPVDQPLEHFNALMADYLKAHEEMRKLLKAALRF
jgi:uncharacterized protein (DUF1778 family)